MEDEIPLVGGNASGVVVRVGSTIRKPWAASTPVVIDYMRHLASAGIDVPAPLGQDDLRRQVIEFVPGRLAEDLLPLELDQLSRVGGLVRAIHDASAGFELPAAARPLNLITPPGDDLMCHNDLAPWNLVVGDRWVFIDWDGSALSTRLWDLAYAAQAFCLNDPAADVGRSADRLAAFVDGYGAEGGLRWALPRAMGERTAAMHAMLEDAHYTGAEPWSTMYSEGHGDHWAAVTRYVRRHEGVWRSALDRVAASPADG